MRRIILTTTALALALSAGVQAQSGRYPDRYPDRDRDRYDDRYGDRDRFERVAVIAHDIDRTAESIYRQAARNNRRPDRAEQRMLYALRDLASAADRFHADVERGGSRGARQPYRNLLRSFDQTAAALSRVEPRSYIDRGMDRIDDLLWQLSGSYRAGNDRYDRGGRGRGRGGRWGSDRDDWRHGDRGRWEQRHDHDDDDDHDDDH